MQPIEAELQWGGRFTSPPDARLLAFGSSLEDDLVLAQFDVQCSRAHVIALRGAAVLSEGEVASILYALETIAGEIATGAFAVFARAGSFEDVHGAIDARVRALAPDGVGERLHAGRSRNDQVATTLLLYARDRARSGVTMCATIARRFFDLAETAVTAGTTLAATTHWQPAQPVLFGFWLQAAGEMFVRATERLARVADDAGRFSPLGSGALAGSSLPLDRAAAARELGFSAPSRNALDSVGDRDVPLDLLHAITRAVVTASRPSEEFVIWSTPAFGYAQLGDAASTGSSLMPQKRNPDPFELVRATAARLGGTTAAALATVTGIGLSYHRDLQETKSLVVDGTERGLAALEAFAIALNDLEFDAGRLDDAALRGFTTATDASDALIARGVTARDAHRAVGIAVSEAAEAGRETFAPEDVAAIAARSGQSDIEIPLDARTSIEGKRTSGSTRSSDVRSAIAQSRAALRALEHDSA